MAEIRRKLAQYLRTKLINDKILIKTLGVYNPPYTHIDEIISRENLS